uniref:hypothetical protein n=1 Tax=Dichomitus squalens TaxID=114155 RepID=UPI0030033283|nr:hypothetical protein [Dichomitus squalens]
MTKLLGYNNIFDFIFNFYYIKLYCYITCPLAIIYQILNIYFLHKFYNQNMLISEVLPDFIINWLKDIKAMSASKETVNLFKNTCYIEMIIYITLMIIITLLK